MLCEGLSPGSAACPRQCLSLARPDPARSCALKMAASAGLGTAVPRGGGASPVPWGHPGLLCQHSTEDSLGTLSPRCCVLMLSRPSCSPLTAACPLQGDHQRDPSDG